MVQSPDSSCDHVDHTLLLTCMGNCLVFLSVSEGTEKPSSDRFSLFLSQQPSLCRCSRLQSHTSAEAQWLVVEMLEEKSQKHSAVYHSTESLFLSFQVSCSEEFEDEWL